MSVFSLAMSPEIVTEKHFGRVNQVHERWSSRLKPGP